MGEGEEAEDLRSLPAHCCEETGRFLWYHLDKTCPWEPHYSPCPESWTLRHLTTFVIFTPGACPAFAFFSGKSTLASAPRWPLSRSGQPGKWRGRRHQAPGRTAAVQPAAPVAAAKPAHAAPGARRESRPQPASSRLRRRPGPGRSREEDDASSPQSAGSKTRCKALGRKSSERRLGVLRAEPGELLRQLPSLCRGGLAQALSEWRFR